MFKVWHVIYGIRALPEGYASGLRNILYADGHLGRELPANLPVTAWVAVLPIPRYSGRVTTQIRIA